MDTLYVDLWRMCSDARDVRKYLHGARTAVIQLEGISETYKDLDFLYDISVTKAEIEHEQELEKIYQ